MAAASHEGPLPGANAVGEAGSLDSGPGVRLRLRVGLDRRIRAARWEVRACGDARCAAEAVCDVLAGATVDDAARTTEAAVARLAGLTTANPAARLVHGALRGALRAWVLPGARRGGEIVCACFALDRETLVGRIRETGARSLDELREHLPATRGCGTCRPDVEALLAELLRGD